MTSSLATSIARISATFMILRLFSGLVLAADPASQADARLTTEGEIWQGQRVIVTLTLKTPDTFASAPAFDLPKIPGTLIVPPTGSPILGTETIGDDSYTTQTHELNVFPQQAGHVTIPSFTIRFDSSVGFGKPVHARTVTTPVISFTVKQPPGTEKLTVVMTTRKLNVTESWQPELSEKPISVGDAFTRTVQIQADNLAGIVLPSFRMKVPEGLRVYDHAPVVNDQNSRGDLAGKRIETATIVCELAGNYELPAMTVKWWNPQEQKLYETSLPAHAITVMDSSKDNQANKAGSIPATTSSERSQVPKLIALFAILIVAGYLAERTLKDRWHAMLASLAQSEHHDFAAVVTACHSGNAKDAYRTILAWREKIESTFEPRMCPAIPRFESDPQLLAEFELLELNVYGQSKTSVSSTWSSDRLLNCLTQFRTRWKHGQAMCDRKDVLPEMNPQFRR